jgi:FAD/FMN-containing dehydrogenase
MADAATTMGAGDLDDLRASVRGPVLDPDDSGFDHVRRCFNAAIDRRPAVIVRPLEAGDIATALDFARSEGYEVAVRGGGHNPAGHCVCDDGLVIDLSLMRRVEVDPATRIARSQGGTTWLNMDSATQQFGLAVPGGVVGTTGVAGLTFGGGIGHLTAQLGFTCDHLLGADVVTADGSVVTAGDEGDPELLWGIRGGGGNFGIATELRFRAHPVEQVVGGRIECVGEGIAEALRRFRDVVASRPPELSCSALLSLEPEGPTAIIAPCFTGNGESKALDSLRAVPSIARDAVRRHSFAAQQHVFNPDYGVERTYWKGHFVTELPDELIDALVARLSALGRPPGQILIESLHGVSKDTDVSEAALGFREAAFNISAMANWMDPADDDEEIEWARETARQIEPWSLNGSGYVNYMQADEPLERVRAAFGAETFERLQALKRRYDPENALRRNQNVPPG